jgi:divalent metal cation (Fe/Co/Zn/Cd) transporter
VTVASEREALRRRALVLAWLTVGWNLVEGTVAVGLGLAAGSVALLGFGLDSFIETSSGLVMLWRFGTRAAEERAEAIALRLVGVSLLVLAAWIAADSGLALLRREAPEASPWGIVLASVSLVVMPVLAVAKRRVAARLASRALKADAFQTLACMLLSAILLAGLFLNAALGWWWADPVAALAMVPLIAREGMEAVRGEACDD